MTQVGEVSAVFRYPVKSMGGEVLESARLGTEGLRGDRVFAVIDQGTGSVATAKKPRKWAPLLECTARYQAVGAGSSRSRVSIELPDGTSVDGPSSHADRVLSEFLGRPVRLQARATEASGRRAKRRDTSTGEAAAQPGTGPVARRFMDYGPVHLLSQATLAAFEARHPAGLLDPRRFRPNILLHVNDGHGEFPEHDWLGSRLMISDVELDLFDPCPRCVMTTLPQQGLPRDPAILKTVAREPAVPSLTQAPGEPLAAVAGVYARVASSGSIRKGGSVVLLGPYS